MIVPILRILCAVGVLVIMMWYAYLKAQPISFWLHACRRLFLTIIRLCVNIIFYIAYCINKCFIPFSSSTSIMGFMLLATVLIQIVSGFFLGWYYVPEPGLVIEMREEMFNDTRFGVEIFQIHVKGVDVLFVLTYLHILKKIFIKNYIVVEWDGWFLGGYAFFWFHVIVFFGISLSATHLSDLMLTISANMFQSLLLCTKKLHYIIFATEHLNTDQLTRLMMLHYFTPWYYLYLVQLHVMFCHESWDTDQRENTLEDISGSYFSWLYDASVREMQDAWFWSQFVFVYFVEHHFHTSTVNYHFFERWNVSELDEIRFYGVTPHWYFRPLMGIITITPTHYEGLLWVVLWFGLLATFPLLNSFYNSERCYVPIIPMHSSLVQTLAFILYVLSMYCAASMLPYSQHYSNPKGEYGGNFWVKFAYHYTYFYMGWIVHHLDTFEYQMLQYAGPFQSKAYSIYSHSYRRMCAVARAKRNYEEARLAALQKSRRDGGEVIDQRETELIAELANRLTLDNHTALIIILSVLLSY